VPEQQAKEIAVAYVRSNIKFRSSTSFGRITDDIGSSLSRLVAQATGHVTLIASFITPGALERLVAEAEPSVPLSVFTRWHLDEIVAGRDCSPASGD